MGKPKVEISLIIATYNRKELLVPLLLQLEQQTFKNFEVIVSDDGSRDGTVAAVRGLAPALGYPLRVVTQEHLGFRNARARNNGAHIAQGQLLVFIDDDCRPNPLFLASYHQAFAQGHFLAGDILFVPSWEKLAEVLDRHWGTQGLWGANLAISRALFWKIGGFDEDFVNEAGADTDLDRRLSLLGVRRQRVEGAHVYHLGLPGRAGLPNDLYSRVKAHESIIRRNEQRWLALSFDDGPEPAYTIPILDYLYRTGIRATFFVVGEKVCRQPQIIRRMIDEGHEIGNHTFSHRRLRDLPASEILWEIETTEKVLAPFFANQDQGFRPSQPLFRFPYFDSDRQSEAVVESRGYRIIQASVTCPDWLKPGVDQIVYTVLEQAAPKGIILLHDGGGDRRQTVLALPEIVKGLQKRGFRLVTVGELLAFNEPLEKGS